MDPKNRANQRNAAELVHESVGPMREVRSIPMNDRASSEDEEQNDSRQLTEQSFEDGTHVHENDHQCHISPKAPM
ncbi:MAG TPA: hypothetical protein PK402_14120 [Tepidisphaeraceae bacterium]|nr:hypothetical protein [Tepidisphaeraceae bacterium]